MNMQEMMQMNNCLPNCSFYIDDDGSKVLCKYEWIDNDLKLSYNTIAKELMHDWDEEPNISTTSLVFGRISYEMPMDESQGIAEITFICEYLFKDGENKTINQLINDNDTIMMSAYVEVIKSLFATIKHK